MSDVDVVEDAPFLTGDVKQDAPAKVISSIMGLMGFATSLVLGLLAGNPGLVILGRAMLMLAICTVIGRILGTVGEMCVREFLNKYKSDHPTPVLPEQLARLYADRAREESIRERMRKSA
ncbi:MAG: hypothetical protein AB8C13_02545 [Phycisphaerales bacterium]